jgi:hypothetical protein
MAASAGLLVQAASPRRRRRSRSDLVHQAFSSTTVETHPDLNCTDLLDSALRSDVLRVNEEDDAAHEPEGVLEQEPFHLAVEGTAPMRPRQECPADLDFAPASVIAMKTRRANDAAIAAVDRDERASGSEVLREERAKELLPIAIGHRMLLPDQPIRGHCIEIGEIGLAKRPQLEGVAN